MRVFLRLNRGEFYYGGHEYWVQTAEDAFDLESIESATEVGRKENLDSMEIVVSFGDPTCDLLLPLSRRRSRQTGAPECPTYAISSEHPGRGPGRLIQPPYRRV